MKRMTLALLLAVGLSGCDGTGKVGIDANLDGQGLDLVSSDGAASVDAVGVPDADMSTSDAGDVLMDIGADAVDVQFQDSLFDLIDDLPEEVIEDTFVDSSPDIEVDPGCCFIDSMCANGEICVGGGLGGFPGTCVLAPAPGQCWEDDHCTEGQICQGANWCPCAEVCDAMQYYGPGQCAVPSSCLTGVIDQQGVGTPCDTNPDACDGLVANMCIMGVFADPNLPAFCTHYCNAIDTCAPGSFCFPAGWSSSCVPDSCADAFLNSCVSNIACVVATQWDTCCPCPEIKTRAQVEMDPCLVEGSTIPSDLPPECVVFCPYELCEECQILTEGHCENYKCLPGPEGS